MRAPSGPDVAVGDVLLSVENVSLSFGGVKAVSDVSFDIRKGEIRAIIGPNGAGKTSMLNVINGFYQPQEGRITSRARRARRCAPTKPPWRHRAHLPERRAVPRHDGARQHHGRPHPEDEQELLLAVAAPRPGLPRRSSTATGRGDHRLPKDTGDPTRPRLADCPTACRSGSSSAARSPSSPICCCSTSRWPA